jgi:sensor c-di-GMP phosphodiesterase-like protein
VAPACESTRLSGSLGEGYFAYIERTVDEVGRNLGLEVIAEGVETTAQADFLKGGRLPGIARFLFSKPLPATAFEDYLRSGIFLTDLRLA